MATTKIKTIEELAANLYQIWVEIDALATNVSGEELCTEATGLLKPIKDALGSLKLQHDDLLNQVYGKLVARTMVYTNEGKIGKELAAESNHLVEALISNYRLHDKTPITEENQ